MRRHGKKTGVANLFDQTGLSVDSRDHQSILEEVVQVVNALLEKGLVRNCDTNKERAIYVQDCAADFFLVCEALNSSAPLDYHTRFGSQHSAMLWAVFTAMRERDVFQPDKLDRADVLSIYSKQANEESKSRT
jgi:hypothetical protein